MNSIFLNSPATSVIIGINIIIFALVNLRAFDVKMLGSSYMDTIQNRQYYRIVSSAFTQKTYHVSLWAECTGMQNHK